MMAVACLMIEALESFYQGWPDTNGRSKDAFCKFADWNSEIWRELREKMKAVCDNCGRS